MIAHIFTDRCTGCEACVAACPTHVLDPGADGVPVIARLDQCQTCCMCELYCEADAIYVASDQRHPERIDPDAVAASGELGSLRRGYRWTGKAASRAASTNSGALAPCCAKEPRSRPGATGTATRASRTPDAPPLLHINQTKL